MDLKVCLRWYECLGTNLYVSVGLKKTLLSRVPLWYN